MENNDNGNGFGELSRKYEMLAGKVESLGIEFSAAREKINFASTIFDKLDEAIAKLERIVESRRMEDIAQQKFWNERLEKSEEKLLGHIVKLQQRVDDVNRWRWFLIGASTTLGWLLAHIAKDIPLLN